MGDQEDRAVNALVRNGFVTSKSTSRRIVKEVLRAVLNDGSNRHVNVHSNDVDTLDQLTDEISHLVWELEDDASDHKKRLLGLINKSQHIIHIASRYVIPGEDHKFQV